jgi:transposase
MRTNGTAAELERRRFLAVERLRDGYPAQQVADFLGVHLRTVRLWHSRFRRRGKAGLRAKPPPGRPPKLTARQERTVLSWFRQSPRSFGFSTDLWTARRVALVIQRQWSVVFNHREPNAWLARRDVTPQKPQRVHPRLTIESLPPYAPQLNPVEHLWSHLKWSALCNVAPSDAAELNAAIIPRLTAAKRDKRLMSSFWKGARLNPTGGVVRMTVSNSPLVLPGSRRPSPIHWTRCPM